MKRYNLLKLLFVGLTVFGFTSCKESFLETPPLDNLTAPAFFNTDAELMAGTAALYNKVWFGSNGQALLSFGDGRAGNMLSPYNTNWEQFYQFNVSNTNGDLSSSWNSFFTIVAQCNVLMYNVETYAKPEVSQAAKDRAIGEAKYMRAVAYSYLVQNWGPVPIITDNLKQGGDTTQTRNTVESVWEFCIRDMQSAIDLLPTTTVAGSGRLNSYSAKGMLARFYLTRAGLGATGGQRDQAYLDKAKELAKDVLENGPFQLMENYADLFLTANNNNPEQLFGLQWVSNGGYGSGNQFQSQFAANSQLTGFQDGWGGGNGASFDYLINLDPADSVRRKATFMLPADHYPELVKSKGGYSVPVPSDDAWTTFANFKKYVVGTPDDNGGLGQQQNAPNNTYMQRLADVHFIYAEAVLGNNASTSDPEALRYYNAIRERATLEPVTSFTLDDLLHERRYEFAVEGDAWYDMVRLYYYNPQKVIDIIGNQIRGIYTIRIVEGTGTPQKKREFEFINRNEERFTLVPSKFYLPIPDTETAQAPNLLLEPVPYEFN
ncbi:RagB/SusD family nutrient uptake outer membrane protein [Arcticibacterium luteifluviistationis]|uniref:RagB/SusD family nutrient uptake outer membrane protein n=1 Tax=Arcticibacterium luteifluviistationis TaxID=1784714 RepID=A0A2Z4GB22_9BACT|nr:RagB/SusD family nutrient uptake outer membrane protein [Arcticibacterium luteifluviistationis]AWV98278.1 RagB/SusD family nutrient uptake outer membrane protein [Arcticibacterium luteifluviistationis]